MRIIFFLFILNVIANTNIFAAGENAKINVPLTVRADIWCPHNCIPKSENPGYFIEVLEHIFGKENISYEELNWARAIQQTKLGEFDMIVGAAQDDAPDFIFPKTPLGRNTNCFYTRPDSTWTYENIGSVKALKGGLAVVKDYAYFEELNVFIKSKEAESIIQSHHGNNVLANMLKKLEVKRVDALIENPNVINYVFKDAKELPIRKAGCMDTGAIYVAFSPSKNKPKSQSYADQFDREIAIMMKNGEFEKILAKYNLKPWF